MGKATMKLSKGVLVFLGMFALLLLVAEAVAQPVVIAQFAVHTDAYERVDVPVTASLKGVPLHGPVGAVQLYEITDDKNIPVASQLEAGAPAQLAWILDGTTPPGTVRTFELRSVEAEHTPPGQGVQVDDDGANLRVHIGDRPVLAYRYALQEAPEGVDEIYSRSGFIHPLWSPEGQVLSRIQPPDHYHHYGIWNPWTRTAFEGRAIDFWNLGDGQGTVRAEHVLERMEGPVAGGFKALLDHVDVSAPSGEKVALHEQWDVKVWHVDPERGVWLIDFVSRLNPATDEPLTIQAYRYQGFSLRAVETWNDETARLLTSEGYDKSNANATRARWIDVNGVSEAAAGTSGVLFMTHPANYNYPEQLRIWPVGANEGVENVFINFNPAQDRDWTLMPGRTYALHYRMLVYDGTLDEAEAEQYWQNFAHPPRVTVYPTGALAGARVLVYTKNGAGYVHDNIPHSIAAIEKLGEEHGFAVDASDDPAVFTDENLRKYDALIFSNTNNETFDTEAQRRALQTYIQQGGGFVGIHSVSGSERTWPWFSNLVGGNFERHAPQQDFAVRIVDRAHPSTAFLPNAWAIEDDECYYLKELNPGIRVLLAANLATVSDDRKDEFPGVLFGDSFPVAWYQEFNGGRQWYTSLGHRPEQYEDPVFMRHILGGIQWAVGGTAP